MAKKMENLAKQQEGYIGIDSARNDVGITISYGQREMQLKIGKRIRSICLLKKKAEHNSTIGIM